MAIDQVRAAQLIGSLYQTEGKSSLSQSVTPFEEYLKEAVGQVLDTEATEKANTVSLVTGSSDSLHNITLNAAKADLAVQMLVAVRNKALDAYNEIMRVTL